MVFVVTFLVMTTGLLAWEIDGVVNIERSHDLVQKVNAQNLNMEIVAIGEGNEKRNDWVDNRVVAEDARPLIIKRYLAKYNSPLLPQADLIFQLSQTYGIGYDWVLAIGQQESNLCKKIPVDSFNCWGYGINSKGTLRFDSFEASLKSYFEYLQREYFNKGLDTEELIMHKYCPHSNGSWAYGVKHFREEINSGVF